MIEKTKGDKKVTSAFPGLSINDCVGNPMQPSYCKLNPQTLVAAHDIFKARQSNPSLSTVLSMSNDCLHNNIFVLHLGLLKFPCLE